MPFALLNNATFNLQSGPTNPAKRAVHGWIGVGSSNFGLYAPGATYYTNPPAYGPNVAVIYSPATLSQYLPYEFVEGATYVLRVLFGWRKTEVSQPTYDLYIFDSRTGTILANKASPGSIAPGTVQDTFVTAEIRYTADATYAGNHIGIGFQRLSGGLDIDVVSLEVLNDDTWGGEDVWLDERDPGAAPAAGSWTDYSQTWNTQMINGGLRGAIDVSQQYQWQPSISAGRYQVKVYLPYSTGTYSSSVDYTIINDGAPGNVNIDQEANKLYWMDLGTYDFDGISGYVQSSGGGGLFVAADAVSWHKLAPAGGISVSITGVQSATDAGVLSIAQNIAPVTGVSADIAAGSLSLSTELEISISGDQAIAAAGSLMISEGDSMNISGVEAGTGAGLLIPDVSGNTFAQVPGASITAQPGVPSIDVTSNILASINGVATLSLLGSLSVVVEGQEIFVPIPGVQILSGLGSLGPQSPFTVDLMGVSARIELGEARPVLGNWLPEPVPSTVWLPEPEAE